MWHETALHSTDYGPVLQSSAVVLWYTMSQADIINNDYLKFISYYIIVLYCSVLHGLAVMLLRGCGAVGSIDTQ